MKRTENGIGIADINRSVWLAIALALTGIVLPLWAAPPPGGTAPVTAPAGGFAIDGDLLANTPVAGAGDWVVSPDFSGSGGGVLATDGAPFNPGRTFHLIDPWGNSGGDIIFAGGLKWTDNPNSWTWTGGKPSSKTEINNVLMHVATDANDQVWMAVAADRASTSGDSYIDFEFLQNPLVRTNDGKFVSHGPQGGRTVNDLLLSLAFTGGGKVADFLAYRWLPDGNGGYAYVDVTAALPAGGVFVGLNSNTIPVAYGAFGKTTYAANAFVEAIVNMTALLAGFDPCASIGFKTIMVKTKASSSSTASIEDCIDPVQYNLRIGPVADAGPDQAVCDAGDSTLFEIRGTATGGLRPVKSVLWEVVSGSAVIASPNSLSTSVVVPSGAATLRLTATQENGCVAVDEVVLQVKALPVADIAGSGTVCPSVKVTYQAPSGMSSYAWSITGNGEIDGQSNAREVTVLPGWQCGETFTLSLTVSSNGCSSSANHTVTVMDTEAPMFAALPGPSTIQCPATPAFAQAIATDNCGGAFQLSHQDVRTAGPCAGQYSVTRTWTAVDACGNTSTASQTINVIDVAAPVIAVLPGPSTIECPATPEFVQATASDACGSAIELTYKDVRTDGPCAGQYGVTRTWTAMDACGNTSSASQTINVHDSQPPALVLPVNLTLECGADTTPSRTGVATAQDPCTGAIVRYSDAVTNICGGSRVILRTWSATDMCGNSTNGVQTITVRDTTPPSLVLPANLALECPGDTRTNVTGVPTVQDTCGSVTVGYQDVVTTNCGITRLVQRLWIAVDQCGNTTNGLQTILVQDTRKPAISCPAIKVQCAGDVPAPYPSLAAFLAAGGTAADTCDATLAFSLVSDSGLVGSCPGKVTRLYRVTDDCGNFADGTQTIVVDDTIAPVLACPPSVTFECTNSIAPADIGQATATDNCDANVAITYADAVVPSQYLVKWYAADPDGGHAPYLPTYLKLAPGSLACPDEARLTGRAADPLRNAVAYGPTSSTLDALTSLGAEPMALGQIVPFETVIEVSGGSTRPENGTIEFTTSWSTHTTSNDEFGYDKNYMVYCAFVDVSDPGLLDPHNNARVESYQSRLVDAGTVNEKIQGTFRISGLDSGDKVVVEIWVVLMSSTPRNFGGTIASDLVSAQKALTPPQSISTGAQTVSIGNLSKLGALPPPQEQPPLPPIPQQPPPLPGYTVTVIDRTWKALDDCGNQDTCIQRITLRDTTPPVITVPPNVALDCTADYGTNVTGTASASDSCGVATLSFSDIVTNACGSAGSVLRTWTASDGYNTANSVQVITMQDTMPPTITCAGDRSVLATEVWTFDEPTAVDTCGAALIGVLSTVTNQVAADRMVVTRTWQASDVCGNVATCQQVITVVSPAPLIAPAIMTHPECQLAGLGGTASLTVEATGTGPLSYQWQFNGVNIAGATGSTLSLENLLFANAGLYTVVVSNAAGTVRSPAAIINVAPVLQYTYANHELRLTWPEGFILQSAPTPYGPYLDEPGAISPFVQNVLLDPQKYFRLRADSPDLTTTILPSGQTCINISGAPGLTVIVQASTDLVHWVNVYTNTAPAQFVDPDSGQSGMRFYRAVPYCVESGMRAGQPPVIISQSASQTASQGEDLTLAVSAQSAAPCAFQWQLNGVSIPGATGSALVLRDLAFSAAGVYSVLAGNFDGTVAGAPIVVDVAPRLLSSMIDGRLVLSWPTAFALQSASSPLGPFVDVPGAVSPYRPDYSAAPMQFYRLRSVPPVITTQRLADGQVSVTLRGSPGINYVIQATSNFVDWTSLHTGTVPCTYVDADAAGLAARYYRAVPASAALGGSELD